MDNKIEFFKIDEYQMYKFYQVPKELFTNELYNNIKIEDSLKSKLELQRFNLLPYIRTFKVTYMCDLYKYIIESIKEILTFNIDTSICYCIGSGKNYEFLLKINKEYNFFKKIIPLEHPRFIMQYNSKNKDLYLKKYLIALIIK